MLINNIKKQFVSIRLKLIFMMIGICIIPFIFIVFINIATLKSEIEKAIHKEHELIASEISQTVVEMVKTTQESLETITLTNPDIFNENNKANREDTVYRMLKKFTYLEEISMVSPEGNELVRISRRYVVSPDELKNISLEEKFKVLREGNLYIGKPEIDYENQIVFELGVPFGGEEEYFSGAIIAKISLRQIMKKIDIAKTNRGSYIMLIDDKGSLIGHSDYSQVTRRQDVTKSKGVGNIIKLNAKKDNGLRYENFQTLIYESYLGEKVLGVYGLIPIVNWGVVVEQPLNIAYKPLRLILTRTILIFFITIIVITLAASILVYFFMKPIKELEKGVNAVRQGNFNYMIPKNNNDELGLVIDAFNRMTDEIKRKQENESLIMLAEKRAAIGTLAAGVAHEINNPMNNLSFYATDLLERLKIEDINELYKAGVIQEYLEIIKEQIDRCAEITQNLLKFSRESKLDIGPVDIYKVIIDILKLMDHRIRKQNVEIKINVNLETPVIMADESQIQQMLLNIITNAVDAMEDVGDRQRKLMISLNEIDNYINIKIKDNGQGIKEKDKARVFDPFFTTKPIGKGTGLGLSISQAIVERLRGSIEIYSEENVGTEVDIRLPNHKEVNLYG